MKQIEDAKNKEIVEGLVEKEVISLKRDEIMKF